MLYTVICTQHCLGLLTIAVHATAFTVCLDVAQSGADEVDHVLG